MTLQIGIYDVSQCKFVFLRSPIKILCSSVRTPNKAVGVLEKIAPNTSSQLSLLPPSPSGLTAEIINEGLKPVDVIKAFSFAAFDIVLIDEGSRNQQRTMGLPKRAIQGNRCEDYLYGDAAQLPPE